MLRPGLPKPEAVLLRLQLLGRMQALTLSNESVLPLGRKTRGLLAILAMSGRRPVLRSRLAELLWSRRSEEQARASLRQEIHRLLDALGPVGADVITVERHTLALKPALTSVDAERILNANGNQADSLPPIEGVLLDELTGTDPALDVWLLTERNRLREHAIGLFEEMLRRQRDTEGTLAAARQLLLLDGLHERAWRAQIQTHMARGETGLALQSAERCAAAFADRHGAEPGPETRRLLSDLRRGHDHDDEAPGLPPAGAPPELVQQPAQTAGAAASEPGRPVLHAEAVVQPERLMRLVEATETLRRAAANGLPLLAVLPLLDLGGSDRFPILTHGLADDLCAGLVGQTVLKLLHGSELQASLAHGRDDAILRRSFGLDYVLDGTVQHTADRIRVILRLTDIRQHGQIVWAQRFDAPGADALALQDMITLQVVARLPWEIMLVESRRLRHRPAAELDPYGMVMRAVACVLSGERAQSDQAVLLLRPLCQSEGGDALPHLVSSLTHLLRRLQRWGDAEQEASLARAGMHAALQREPGHAGAMALCCLIRSELDDEPEAGLTVVERTLSQHPESAMAWAASVFPLLRLGRLEEAAAQFSRYKSLFPTHPVELLLDRPGIMIPLLQGEFEEAARVGTILSELHPGFAPNLVPFLAALGHLHRVGEAERIRRRLQAILPDDGVESLVQAAGLRRPEDRDRLAAGLRLAGLPDTIDSGQLAKAAGAAMAAPMDGALGAARMAG